MTQVKAYTTPERVLVLIDQSSQRNIYLGSITEVTNVNMGDLGKTKTAFLRIGDREIIPFDAELYATVLNIWLKYLRDDDFSNEG